MAGVREPDAQRRTVPRLFLSAEEVLADEEDRFKDCAHDEQGLDRFADRAIRHRQRLRESAYPGRVPFRFGGSVHLRELITVAQERAKKLALHDVDGLPVIFGLDVARFGDDNSSLWMRQGVMTKRLFSVNGYDNIRLARLLVEHMKYEKPRAVFLDISGGLGAGVYDYLKDLGYNNIHAVNFGAKADKADRYANKRCEMYAEAKEWLIDGGCLPYEGKEAEDAAEDLAAQEYFIDRNSRTALVEKEDIKEALGRSPDDGDALVLTFAAPVAAEDGLNRLGPVAGAAPRKYDPLWRTKRR